MSPLELDEAIDYWQEQPTRIILLAGRRGTGKDEVQDYLLAHYPHMPIYRIADGPTGVANFLRIEPTRAVQHALFGLNKLLYPILGESAYKRLVAMRLDEDQPAHAIVAALRTEEEYKEFVVKRKGILIGLCALPKVRFGRTRIRAQMGSLEKNDEGTFTFEEFMGNQEKQTGEYHPIEREIDLIVDRAHFIIENNFDKLEPFHAELANVTNKLGLNSP
jgi:hypothetical protein